MGKPNDHGRLTRIVLCRALIRLDALMEKSLGKTLSTRAHWMVLLELYLAAMEGRTLFQSCLSTTESPSAPHRRSAYLARMGFLQREHDPGDNRRVNLALCPSTMRLLDKAMDRIVTLHEHTAGEMAGLSSPQPREGQVKYPKAQVCAEGLDGMKCPQGKIIAGADLFCPWTYGAV
jgi:DNA-binding MarR family transcriptional regulator